MNQEKTTEIYEQEKHRMKNSANYFSVKTGIETDELLSEANLAFCKSFKTFDKKKARFSTHLHNNINYALLNFANKNRRSLSLVELNNPQKKYKYHKEQSKKSNPSYFGEQINWNEFDAPAKEEIQFCIEDNFSPLAAEVVRIIIDQELTHLSQLTQILLKKGYKNSTYKNYPSQIQSIYQEIRETINANKRRRNGNGKHK